MTEHSNQSKLNADDTAQSKTASETFPSDIH